MGSIASENALTGNLPSEWDVNGIGDPSIQGFATDFSVNRGTTVQFKINTTASAYHIDIYRLGYYGGRGARKVATINPSASLPQIQPTFVSDPATGLVDCGNWAVSASWAVPATATSGVYIARPVRTDNSGASHIIFVVRDDAGASDFLFQTADTTWQAYNNYGGINLYRYRATPPYRAYKVSYNRPFNNRGGTQFAERESFLFNSEYPMIRWMEANGYNVSYASGMDTDRRGSATLLTHKVFLSVGHDEYWSGQQRTNIETARAGGVHLGFFSGNEIYWKTRWENSIAGPSTAYRTLVCYKETIANAKVDPSAEWTGTWRDPRFSPPSDGGRPENALTGQFFTVDAFRNDPMLISSSEGKMRFWRNTSIAALAEGQTAQLPAGVLGFEWNEVRDNGFQPPGSFRLSTTTFAVDRYLQDYGSVFAPATATHSMTLYRHGSGALVFGSGTVQWPWGLDANHDFPGTPVDVRMQQATVNLFADMDTQPATLQAGLVAATASTDTIAPTSVIHISPGGTIPAGYPATIMGTATDTGGGLPAGVEFSYDGGATWHLAAGAANWSGTWTPLEPGAVSFKSRAVDDSGRIESPGPGISATIVGGMVNGSFESNFTGWTATGNLGIYSQYPSAPDGTKIAAFNGGDLTPNGVLSQTFATIVGQSYTLSFSQGVLANNTNSQTMLVTVTGSGSLLSQSITINGLGGGATRWVPQSFTFVADSTTSTLTFRDQSATTGSLDLLLDKVRVTAATQPQVATPTFNPVGGTYATAQSVTLSDTSPGAAIYYTTNGSTPTTSSTFYTAPITVATTTTIKSMAAMPGWLNSAVASATYTIQANLPVAPAGLAASSVSGTQINLAWVDSGSNETGFKIERKTGAGGSYAQIATTGANIAIYSNTGLTPGTTYFYRVRATNAIGDSPYSPEASATPFSPAFRAAASNAAASGVLSLSIDKPAGTLPGDVMAASIAVRPETATITAPAGWTLVQRIDNPSTTANSLAVYDKVAGASEPVSYSWTFNTSTGAVGGIQSFSGIDTSNPIDRQAGHNTFSSLNHATLSITTQFTYDMLVTSHAFSSSATFTPPAGMTEAFEIASATIPSTDGESIQGNFQLRPTAGSTGTRTATASNNADRGNAHILALKASTTTVNAAPAADPQSVSVAEGGTLMIALTGSDADTNSLIFATGSAAHGTVSLAGAVATYTPAANYNGTDSFNFTVSDGTATSAPATVSITVTPVNGAPVNTVPVAQTVVENTALAIAGMSVNDLDGNLATARLSVANGKLTVSLTGGATISAGVNGTNTLTLAGTQTQVNAALGTIVYQGNLNYAGTDTLELLSTDANAATDLDAVSITVTSVNTAPTISDIAALSTNEDTVTPAIAFTIGDLETASADLTVTAGSSNLSLVPLANVILGGSGANRSVTITPAANQTGTATITLTVSDGALTASDTFLLTVNATVSAGLVNGSFESNFTGWTVTGNVFIESATSPYTATNGIKMASFNGNSASDSAANGVTFQVFATSPGTPYTLAFDMGVIGTVNEEQKFQVTVDGAGNLLSQIATKTKVTGSTAQWTAMSYTFVANSAVTTLTFRDISATTINIDALLDNVRVTTGGPVTAPQAVNDSATLHSGQKVRLAVLANDTGTFDPNLLEIVSPAAAGTATIVPPGEILYTHPGANMAPVSFTYRVSGAGGQSLPATVAIAISPALRIPNNNLNVPAETPPTAVQVVPAFPGVTFTDPLCFVSPPGDTSRLFVCEFGGRIKVIPDVTVASPISSLVLDLPAVISTPPRTPAESFDPGSDGEAGLLGMAFHPDYTTNGYFYVSYMIEKANESSVWYQRLSRFTVPAAQIGQPAPVADPTSERILIEQRDRSFGHNGSDLHFGADGYLYWSIGDEGYEPGLSNNSQRIDMNFFSAMLRIDVDKKPGNREPNAHPNPAAAGLGLNTVNAIPRDEIPAGSGNFFARYSIPIDNPFVSISQGGTWNSVFNGNAITATNLPYVRSEFWAVGLRSPWRFSIDEPTGEIWLGDVGFETYEEVDLITKGANYGWAFREGLHNGLSAPPPGFTSTDPIYEYGHTGQPGDSTFKGNSIIGGVIYRGTRFGSLTGAYIFGDHISGHIWALTRPGGVTTVERIAGQPGLSTFGADPSNGDVLVSDYFGGRIMRIVTGATSSSYPATLSATRLFADLADLSPAPGVLPYAPNLAFWSDYAIKRRWFIIPEATSTMTWSRDDSWTFPSGQIWVKHFDLETERGNVASPKKRIETRLLVKNDAGVYGVSYRWNEAGTEATLVADGGEDFPIDITVNGAPYSQQWTIPSRAQCITCHSPQAGHALSFNTRQLNLDNTINGFAGNQLDLLHGYFSNTPESPNVLPRHLRPGETAYPLEARVRSYLAVNCSYCHAGAAGTAPPAWDGRHEITLDQTGLINGATSQAGDPFRLIVPGGVPDAAEHSVVLQRMGATGGFTRMPPLGTHEVNPVDIQLVTDWINQSLPGRVTYDQWRLETFASASSPEGEPGADPDGDGFSNRAEFLAGTLAWNGSSFLIPGVSLSDSNVFLNFTIPANRSVQVESSGNLADWSLWDIPANNGIALPGGNTTFSGPAAAPNQFYRLLIRER